MGWSGNEPCISHRTIIPGKPTLQLAIYVYDFLYFSLDEEVEQDFQKALSQNIKVVYGNVEWYLGMKFDWSTSSDGSVNCHISQEGYAAAIVKEMGLSQANTSPPITLY
jgi:hypothetical protein